MLYNNIIKKHLNNVLSRNFDNFGREINYSIGNSKKADYIYDETNGRLKTMNAVNGGNFEFGYMENANLQNRITYPNGVIKTTSFEEKRNLITGINYQNDANVISNYAYENDVLGRRTNIGITYDNATKSNDYNYNPRSEVIGANGDTLNQAFDYDNIGNRITSSNNDITTNYSTNELNQYTSVSSDPSDSFVPLFDDDGNQLKIKTSAGEFSVNYNAENRPIKFTNLSDSSFITMRYDYMGRRGGKLYFNSQGTWTSTAKFFYKDYTLIEESTASNDILKEFVWDPTAGEATRPLVMKHASGGGLTLFYTHDANKNVSELVFWATQNGISAHYEYDAFGNTIITSSNTHDTTVNIKSENPFRFSSEYHDDELGLIYYNYRHYNPQSGRWINRDPIAEKGGNNLYNFVKNNTINQIDILGLLESKDMGLAVKKQPEKEKTKCGVNIKYSLNLKGDLSTILNARISDAFWLTDNPSFYGRAPLSLPTTGECIKCDDKFRIKLIINYQQGLQIAASYTSIWKGMYAKGIDVVVAHEKIHISNLLNFFNSDILPYVQSNSEKSFSQKSECESKIQEISQEIDRLKNAITSYETNHYDPSFDNSFVNKNLYPWTPGAQP